MHLQEAMQALENLGTEQTVKYSGIGENQYGVSYANLETLRKRIKQDDPLAVQLWETCNHDARILATLIADPSRMDEVRIEAWTGSLENYTQADALVKLLGKTPAVRPLAERWVDSPDEWLSRLGWHLLAGLAMNDVALPDSYFVPYLARIEEKIQTAPNRTREGIALIAIGIRSAHLGLCHCGCQADWPGVRRSRRNQL
jgi:3-methyladenine DNA glycosylase AlkD